MAKGEVQQDQTVYGRAELMDGAVAAFGVQPEIVAGALALAGRDAMTRDEAAAAIAAFLKRRV